MKIQPREHLKNGFYVTKSSGVRPAHMKFILPSITNKISLSRDHIKNICHIASHPRVSHFHKYSGNLEFFRGVKSYLSRIIRHTVNFLMPAESHNACPNVTWGVENLLVLLG